MKYFTLIPAVLVSLTSVSALASGYNCKTITGTINHLVPDLDNGALACHIMQAQQPPQYQFPDVTFLYPTIPETGIPGFSLPNSCFYTSLTARFGNRDVAGTVYSGLTQNAPFYPGDTSYQFSAASVITLRLSSNGNLLGRVLTQDVIIEPFDFTTPSTPSSTREFITAVNGTNTFNGVQGHIEVLGNLIEGDQAFTGTLCLPN
jgi:hypothetical protein